MREALLRLAELFDVEAWMRWFAELDRGFAFLLLLPFVVAVVGLWAERYRDDDEDGPGR